MTERSRLLACFEDESGFGLVETLIALSIFVIGLVAVAGLTSASASQARIATWRTQQSAAAQIVLEEIQTEGWSSAVSGVDTATVAGKDFPVTISVSTVTSRVKRVTIVVPGVGTADTIVYRTRLYKPLPLPDPPPSP